MLILLGKALAELGTIVDVVVVIVPRRKIDDVVVDRMSLRDDIVSGVEIREVSSLSLSDIRGEDNSVIVDGILDCVGMRKPWMVVVTNGRIKRIAR